MRVRGEVPSVRPDRTLMPGTNLPVGYVSSNPDGDDGRPISDYDVIGSATRRSGLFALEDVDELAFVYIPPLTRTIDIGASTVLVAAKFCRQHRAMLIVDPPAAWDSAAEAVRGVKRLNFHSDNALMFFPRIAAMDRLRGRIEMFGNGGAVAGLVVANRRGRFGSGRGAGSGTAAARGRAGWLVKWRQPIAGRSRLTASTCCTQCAVPIASGRRCARWRAARVHPRTGRIWRSAASRCS